MTSHRSQPRLSATYQRILVDALRADGRVDIVTDTPEGPTPSGREQLKRANVLVQLGLLEPVFPPTRGAAVQIHRFRLTDDGRRACPGLQPGRAPEPGA